MKTKTSSLKWLPLPCLPLDIANGKQRRRIVGLGLSIAVAFAGTILANPASAQGRVACGQVITKSTTLSADVGPCTGDGIIVGADSITLDLNGHRVFGTAGTSGEGVGIRIPRRKYVVVTNGTVSFFDAGVAVRRGSNNTISHLLVDRNAGPTDVGADFGDGILVDSSAHNLLVANVVTHNGPYDGIGVIGTSQANVIQNNDIENNDVIGAFDGARAVGILVSSGSPDREVSSTQIIDNVVRKNDANGIELFFRAGATVVRGNRVEANGFRNAELSQSSVGREIGDAGIVLGSGSSRAVAKRNEVHGNAGSGIMSLGCCGNADYVYSGKNKILDNNAADNAASAASRATSIAYDLFDGFPGCGSDVWLRNMWGSGGFSPACTTNAGPGPAPATGVG